VTTVAKRDLLPADQVRQSRGWFTTIVPSHVDVGAFVALALAELRRNPKLDAAARRNPQSFMSALSECARLGLVPGDTFHLVPFEDRRNKTVEITGITDYTGEIELIYRAGAVASVKAEIVYAKDQFHFTTDMDRPEHAPNWFGDRGDLIGAYAYAVMKDGATSKVVIYSKAEIDRVRELSRAPKRDDSPWERWYDRMALKTVIHRLQHFVPTSSEYRREQIRAAAQVAQEVSGGGLPAAMAELATSAHNGQDTRYPAAGRIREAWDRLGVSDVDEQLNLTASLAGTDTVLDAVEDLPEDDQERIADLLGTCDDLGQVHQLIAAGDKP
jgi:recombination protein RecT